MSLAYIGEIKMVAFNFAPRNFTLCYGQLEAVSQNQALASLLGSMYGGDGVNTYGIPDLRGRIPIHRGLGTGLGINWVQGSKQGVETVKLTSSQIPSHIHALSVEPDEAEYENPYGRNLALPTSAVPLYKKVTSGDNTVNMSSTAIESSGGGQEHINWMPSTVINFALATQGLYPSRN